jgi:hypothetical protein
MNDHTILTRFLYNKNEVFASLLISIFDKKIDESLFWGYELYFSGYTDELFDYLVKIYNVFFKEINTNLEKYMMNLINEWKTDNTKNHVIGSIIKNLAIRCFSLTTFLSRDNPALTVHITEDDTMNIKKMQKKMFITMKEEEIAKYYNEIIFTNTQNDIYRAWKVLRTNCVFRVRREIFELFDTDIFKNAFSLYDLHNFKDDKYTMRIMDNWLYYAGFSPIWQRRIAEHGGFQNHETKKVFFENEEKEEMFCSLFGYEPDEQSLEIQNQFLYRKPDKIHCINIAEFCDLYGKTSLLPAVSFKKPKKKHK